MPTPSYEYKVWQHLAAVPGVSFADPGTEAVWDWSVRLAGSEIARQSGTETSEALATAAALAWIEAQTNEAAAEWTAPA